MTDLPDHFAHQLSADDVDAMRMMAESAEWAEEIGLLVATLVARQRPVSRQELHELRVLLQHMGLSLDELKQLPSAET